MTHLWQAGLLIFSGHAHRLDGEIWISGNYPTCMEALRYALKMASENPWGENGEVDIAIVLKDGDIVWREDKHGRE